MKISHRWFPRLLGLIATASLATLLCAGCGDGGGAGADLSSDTTPAAIGVARDPSGTGIFVAFFDEAGVPVAVERAIFEGLVSVEPQAGLNAMAFKAEGAGAITFIWNSLSTSVKIMPVGLTACSSFELCIGDGVLPKICEEGDCLPLDIAGCYDIAAGKSAGDLLSIEGETGCYDDFVVSSMTESPIGLYPEVFVSIYAGAQDPKAVPDLSRSVVESDDIEGVGGLLIAGNVDGGDSPRIVVKGNNFVAVALGDDVLPELTVDNLAVIGDVRGAAEGGDVNGDGIEELLVADSKNNVFVLPGGSLVNGLHRLEEYGTIRLVPPASMAVAKSPLVGGADINGLPVDADSFDDLVARFETSAGLGVLAVYFGDSAFAGRHSAILVGEQGGDAFGAMAVLGDVDGDGYADLVASAPLYEKGMGALYVFRGGRYFTSASAGNAWMKINGGIWSDQVPAEEQGEQLNIGAYLGDINRDGYGDLAFISRSSTKGGSVNLFFGADAQSINRSWSRTDAAAAVITSELNVSRPTALGDIDGDGVADFAVHVVISDQESAIAIFFGGDRLTQKIAASGAAKTMDALMDADIVIQSFDGEVFRDMAGRIRR